MTTQRKYRKVHEFTAVQWTGSNLDEVAEFNDGQVPFHTGDRLAMMDVRLGRICTVNPEVWLVRDPYGRLTHWSSDEFLATFELVDKS